jgi:hypothetical protein
VSTAPRSPTKDRTGKSFERLVARIQQQLAPHATVTHDVTLVGRSGARNQCDVLVDGKVGPYDVRLLVECKDWAATVGVDVVREVIEKAIDVDAHRAVIVCRAGFSNDAIQLARHRGVVLHTIADAEREDWASIGVYPIEACLIEAGAPELMLLTPDRAHVVTLGREDGTPLPSPEYRFIESATGAVLTVDDILTAVWDQPGLRSFVGDAYELYSPTGASALLDGATEFEIVARVTGPFHRSWRWGHVPFDRGVIVRDAVSGAHVHQSFETSFLSLQTVLTWPQVADRRDVPIAAGLTITMHLGWGKRGPPLESLQISVTADGGTPAPMKGGHEGRR